MFTNSLDILSADMCRRDDIFFFDFDPDFFLYFSYQCCFICLIAIAFPTREKPRVFSLAFCNEDFSVSDMDVGEFIYRRIHSG